MSGWKNGVPAATNKTKARVVSQRARGFRSLGTVPHLSSLDNTLRITDSSQKRVPQLHKEEPPLANTRPEQAAETGRQEQSLAEALISTTQDAVVTIDRQGRVEIFNPAAERIFGYTRAEVLGQDVRMLMPEL